MKVMSPQFTVNVYCLGRAEENENTHRNHFTSVIGIRNINCTMSPWSSR